MQGDCTAGFTDPITGGEEDLNWRDEWNQRVSCVVDAATTQCPDSTGTVVTHPGNGYELIRPSGIVVVPGGIIPGPVSVTPGHWEIVPGATYTEVGPSATIPASVGMVTQTRKVVVR